jgi:predicted ATP-grasp superfamily ATP-dependent carboligase
MRVFVYEFMTASGVGRDPRSIDHGLYREGRAMCRAMAKDMARVPGVEVVTIPEPPDADEPDLDAEEAAFRRLAAGADWCFVIAPETNDVLRDRCAAAITAGSRLLGPSLEAVRLTGGKWSLCRHWSEAGVPTPRTESYGHNSWGSFPCVLKPDCGAGSEATYLVRDQAGMKDAYYDFHPQGWDDEVMILQEFVPGRAASVAFLFGPKGHVPLVPTFQLISDDGRFKYQGGELPIPADLAERAVKLARRAVECVPGLLGYVGVDLVLGDAEDGSADYAIEINPRLTTSYVGLRALADFNVAATMLKVATGEPPGEMKWKSGRLRFDPDGTVKWIGAS